MPRGDGTGPMGMGRMTGRGAGFCAGFQVPGFMNRGGFGGGFGGGMGRGMGRGGGWGRRNMFYATGQPGWVRSGGAGFAPGAGAPVKAEDELANLENECHQAEEYLKQLRSRVEELKSQSDK